MNRREALTRIAGIPCIGDVKIVEPESMPIMGVIEVDGYLTKDGMMNLKKQFNDVFKGKPPFPVIILDGGTRIKFCNKEVIEEEDG